MKRKISLDSEDLKLNYMLDNNCVANLQEDFLINKINIGLLAKDDICSQTFNIPLVASSITKRQKTGYGIVRKLTNLFDIGVSKTLGIYFSTIHLTNLLQDPFYKNNQDFIPNWQTAVTMSLGIHALNSIGSITDDFLNQELTETKRGPLYLEDTGAINCLKLYQNKHNDNDTNQLECNEMNVGKCRAKYIEYHYKNMSPDQFKYYLNLSENIYKLFMQKNEKQSYDYSKKLWRHVLKKYPDSNRDFSFVIIKLLQKVNPDDLLYKKWVKTIEDIIYDLHIGLNDDMVYKNCLLSIAMFMYSKKYQNINSDFKDDPIDLFFNKFTKWKLYDETVKQVITMYKLQSVFTPVSSD